MYGPAGVRFAQHIPFYPPCYFSYIGEEQVTGTIRLFHGRPTISPPSSDAAPMWSDSSVPVPTRSSTAYAGAHHQFDRPGDAVRQSPREQNASRCLWEERVEGQMVNRDSGQPFSLDDPCAAAVAGHLLAPTGASRAALHRR